MLDRDVLIACGGFLGDPLFAALVMTEQEQQWRVPVPTGNHRSGPRIGVGGVGCIYAHPLSRLPLDFHVGDRVEWMPNLLDDNTGDLRLIVDAIARCIQIYT